MKVMKIDDIDISGIDDLEYGLTCKSVKKKEEKHVQIREKVIEERAMKKMIKNNERNFLLARNLDDLCVTPKLGEQWRIITEKSFNAYNFILSILNHGNIDDLYLAIYRINEPTVMSLMSLMEQGVIKHGTFIISSFFNQTKKPEKWAQELCSYCSNHKTTTKFAYLHNHAKICCVKQGDNYFVFEGSGNMSDNARIEQYIYENSEAVFDFHKSWMIELIEKANELQAGRNALHI